LPFDGLIHRFDTKHEQAVLEDPNGAARLAHDDSDGFGSLGDCCRSPVSRSESFGELEIFVEDFDDLSGAFDDTIGSDDEGPVHLGDFFDVFSDPSIVQVSMFTAVTFEGIESAIFAVGEDFSGISHDKEGTDFVSFSAFSTDLDGQIDHDFEVVQRDCRFEPLKVAAGEASHSLVEFDDRDRVHAIGFEAAVDGDDFALAG